MLGENSQYLKLPDVNCYIMLHAVMSMVVIYFIKSMTVRTIQIEGERILMETECDNPTLCIIPPALKDR